MTPELIRIMDLGRALAMCVGALEIIQMSPENFNKQGIKNVLDSAKFILWEDDIKPIDR